MTLMKNRSENFQLQIKCRIKLVLQSSFFADAAMTYDSCHMHFSTIICSFNANREKEEGGRDSKQVSGIAMSTGRACIFDVCFSVFSAIGMFVSFLCTRDATYLHFCLTASKMFNRPQNWMIKERSYCW